MGRFTPKSEEELTRLLPDGTYEAYVFRAHDKKAKSSGDDMIELSLEIYDAEGSKFYVNDNLMFGTTAVWKLHAFCKAAGMLEQYEAGEIFANDVMHKNVKVKISTEPAKDGYPPKNRVKSYIAPKGGDKSEPSHVPNNKAPYKDAPSDPEIPF